MIFDEAFVNRLPAINNYHNPEIVALCRFEHLNSLREQVEKWFLNLPKAERADIKSRLRSMDDGQHMGAFYELLLHQLCIEENWKTELHYLTDENLTPDLKVTTTDKDEFFLEVYTQLDENSVRKLQTAKNRINDAINGLKTPFTLSIHYKENPPLDTDIKALVKDMQSWLNTLDPTSSNFFKYKLNHLGLMAEIDARIEQGLKIKNGGCLLAVVGPVQSGLPGVGKVNNKLKTKRRKYSSSKTKLPLVVAVCDATTQLFGGEMTIDRALFGHPIITFAIDGSDEQPRAGRDNSGLITPKSTNQGYLAQNKGISAVLYCSRVQKERGIIRYRMTITHNPWAYVPFPVRTFEKLMPQFVVTKNDETGIAMEWDKEGHEDMQVFFS